MPKHAFCALMCLLCGRCVSAGPEPWNRLHTSDAISHRTLHLSHVCTSLPCSSCAQAGNTEHARDLGGKGSDCHKAAVIGDTVSVCLLDRCMLL
jgi:hypothetical protein